MDLLEKLSIEKDKIEKHLEELFLCDKELEGSIELKDLIIELIRSGGKRLRPALLITGAGFGNFDCKKNDVYRAAAMVEAIHLSSLVHDDVIDNSKKRRNSRSVNAKAGDKKAVLAGSYIFCRTVEVFSKENNIQEHKTINDGLMAMCHGELQQVDEKYDFDIDVKKYLKKSVAKTAKLISACLFSGAAIAKADEKTAQILAKAGLEIGTAFQIVDDILDFTKDSDILGKPSGNDLINGNITLPVIYAKAEIKKRFPGALQGNDKEALKNAVSLIKQSDSIDRCYALCDKFLVKAKKRIEKINGFSDAKTKLYKIIEYVTMREY